jgi:hypothetical protein
VRVNGFSTRCGGLVLNVVLGAGREPFFGRVVVWGVY